MRTIALITVGRSDYGIYLPLLRRLRADPEIRLQLIVAGMHLAPEFGLTVRDIEADGYAIADRVEMLLASDTPEGLSKSMGIGIMGFAQTYARLAPDIIVALGDRAEMHAAALAALPFNIPVAHIHGGEISAGAIDDSLRHSLTKLSHLHFVATEEYARRVMQLGEEPWRITVSGAPSLDNLHQMELLSVADLERRIGLNLQTPTLLVTFHSVTLEYPQTEWQVTELLAALADVNMPIVFTKPNADPGGRVILQKLEQFVGAHANAHLVDNLGTQAYFSLMKVAAAMVGNSSSGLIEAPSFQLPVVNIGTRQQGRCRAANVLDTGYSRADVSATIQKAVQPEFRSKLHNLVNPFGCGSAADIITARLKSIVLDGALIRKRFQDLEFTSS